jgi:hypothetical protein
VLATITLFAVLAHDVFPVVPALLVAATLGCGFVSQAARLWEARTGPPAPPFCQSPDADPCSRELRADVSAGFWTDRRGFLWERRVWFAGTGCAPHRLRQEDYLRLRRTHAQGDVPVLVTRSQERQWWWWQSAFYCDAEDREAEEVHGILLTAPADGTGASRTWNAR